jgi:hypothetical protein
VPPVTIAAIEIRLRQPRPCRGALACIRCEPLFLEPAGLADGLAPKERRYGLASFARFAPGTVFDAVPTVPPLPAAYRAGFGRFAARSIDLHRRSLQRLAMGALSG